jgi:hypothetical protein
MRYSRLIGALFPLGFVVYGVGNGLVTSVTSGSNFLSTFSAHQNTLILGAFLMLLNSFVDVGKGVLFFPILEKYGKRTALAYLAAMIVEVVLLDVGVLALLMIVPLSSQHGIGGGVAKALGALAVKWNTMAFWIAEAVLAAGGIFLCLLLFRTRLVPRFLGGWGVIGYAIFLVGAMAEIVGMHIGPILLIPGGLFELALGFWLLIKGFEPAPYRAQPVTDSPA